MSIVIPSYNCAPWLTRAVESAFHVGGEAAQVIVVDDGSTDHTPQLCADLSARFPSLQVIRRVNGGLSAARNTGIDAATGEFIFLLDADDEAIAFDLALLSGCETEILRIGVEEVGVDGRCLHHQEHSPSTAGATYLQARLQPVLALYVPSCAYLFRRSFLNEHQLRFTEGLIHEDMLFTVQALLAARTVAATETLAYRYFRRQGSITLQTDLPALRRRVSSLARIASNLTECSNQRPDVDLWRWAENAVDNGWSFVLESDSRYLVWAMVVAEGRLFFRYRLWGVFRSRKDVRYRLRRALVRLFRKENAKRTSVEKGNTRASWH